MTRFEKIGVAFGAIVWLAPSFLHGADLKPQTLRRYEDYIQTVDARNQAHLVPGAAFLSSDEIPGQVDKLRAGEIVVAPGGPHVPMKVPSGLIHDWTAAAFIPDTALSEVIPLVREYVRYEEFYHPYVKDSKGISTTGLRDEFSMIILNKSVVAKTALDSEYQSEYTRIDDHRWYSVSEATRIQEIADYDTPSQHLLPEGHGTGLIWRLRSFTRFEERDGGVYIEIQAVVLSRDVPAALRWFIDPIVRRVSRSSLTTSLRQTEAAVRLQSVSVSAVSADEPLSARDVETWHH
ncbi:MAG: hypothetical protein JOZ32_10380 [Bryobacterales bacterium]|nr:hypothetical protein [Bryobacterales bacterium]